jgi:FAD dependent oxidoreductase TIGR03364
MPRALIVGGGVLGTFHAFEAIDRGWEVQHFDAEPEPHEATARSPGAITSSWAGEGLDLELSLRARATWDALSDRWPGLRLRSTGSLVVALSADEMAVLEDVAGLPSAPEREWRLLDPGEARSLNPALGGAILGALHSPLDALVEPREVLEQVRRELDRHEHYHFRGGVEVRDFDAGSVTDSRGRVVRGDLVVLCPGTRTDLATSITAPPAVLKRVRIQMLQTEPVPAEVRTIVADTTSLLRHLRRSAATGGGLPGPNCPAGEYEVRFNCSQRETGALTVGESREYDEPFEFDLAERPAKAMLSRLGDVLGSPAPSVVRRWAGTVHECVDGRLWYREDLDESVVVVSGTDQRGVTLAPTIAADTFDWVLTGIDSGATRPGALRG